MINPSPSRRRPFKALAVNDGELSALLPAERNTANVLTDWYHRLSDDVFAQYI